MINLYSDGLSWTSGKGRVGNHAPPPFISSENIEAVTLKLKGQIVRPKMFSLRAGTWTYMTNELRHVLKGRPSWIRHKHL